MSEARWLVVLVAIPQIATPTRLVRRERETPLSDADTEELLRNAGFVSHANDPSVEGPLRVRCWIAADPFAEPPVDALRFAARHASIDEALDRARGMTKGVWVARQSKRAAKKRKAPGPPSDQAAA